MCINGKILSIETVLSARTHTHTHTHTHSGTCTHKHTDSTKLNLHKTGSKQRLEMNEDSSMEQKTWHVCIWGKELLRLHLNESREGWCQRRRGRSFHVQWKVFHGKYISVEAVNLAVLIIFAALVIQYTIQLYCLCVEKFAFWLAIYI